MRIFSCEYRTRSFTGSQAEISVADVIIDVPALRKFDDSESTAEPASS
jgi:hypothetical protein